MMHQLHTHELEQIEHEAKVRTPTQTRLSLHMNDVLFLVRNNITNFAQARKKVREAGSKQRAGCLYKYLKEVAFICQKMLANQQDFNTLLDIAKGRKMIEDKIQPQMQVAVNILAEHLAKDDGES